MYDPTMNFLKTNILQHIDGAVPENISGVFPVQAHGLSYSVGPGGAENHYKACFYSIYSFKKSPRSGEKILVRF